MTARAHDIPNQRVDRSIQVTIGPRRLRIDYEVSLSELTLTQDLRGLIGSLPGADRREWLDQFGKITGPLNAKGLFVAVDRRPIDVDFKTFGLVVEEHPRFTFHLEATLPDAGRLEIYDTNYATSEGTSRLAIRAREGVGFTGDLLPVEVSQIPIKPVWDMSDEEELRSKRVVVNYAASTQCLAILPTPAEAAGTSHEVPASVASSKIFAPGLRLNDFLDRTRGTSLPVMLLIAGVLGAAHSLQPGHGKSLVTALSLGKGAVWYHPLILGTMASLAHTGSVLIVAAAIWSTGTSRVENLHQVLARTAGFLIGAVGFWRMGRFLGGHGEHSDETVQHTLKTRGTLELVGLGFSGGMVPCWDAVGLIVLAAALGRLTMGIACVIAFGLGMAIVLVSIGLVAMRFRPTFLASSPSPRFERWLGVGTGLFLAMLGLALFLE